MTTTNTPFTQGLLEEAAEIHLNATNTGEFYAKQISPAIADVARIFPMGRDYHPEAVYGQYLHPADVAIKLYVKEHCLGRSPFTDPITLRAAVARMLEDKYRQEALEQAGVPCAEAILTFDCDAEINRHNNER